MISKKINSLKNFPNPFNGSTRISFELNQGSKIKQQVLDITGRVVDVISEGNFSVGKHEIECKDDVSSGIYFCELIYP